ncbi:MAG: GNAT family N-acetyltransferase [Alphaproteobacteria bacterium]|nr:GNAT family N-acetyltransferase [Alphaproteobacteria bacterium]
MPLHLRLATLEDIPLLDRWERQPHVQQSVGADGPWDWRAAVTAQVDWRRILIAEEDGRPVGFMQMLDPARDEDQYWGPTGPGFRALDIWIGAPEDLGRGLGSAMMRLAIDACFAEPGVQVILIDPLARNTQAHRFYRRLGFVEIGPRRLGDDDCLVFQLQKARHNTTAKARS